MTVLGASETSLLDQRGWPAVVRNLVTVVGADRREVVNAYASAATRKPTLPALLSGVFELRESTR